MGEGVSAAMSDAIGLAKAISESVTSGWSRSLLAQKIELYEEGMRERAKKSVTITEEAMRLMLFTPNAPSATIEQYVVAVTRNDMPFFAVPAVKIPVKAFYSVYRLVL